MLDCSDVQSGHTALCLNCAGTLRRNNT